MPRARDRTRDERSSCPARLLERPPVQPCGQRHQQWPESRLLLAVWRRRTRYCQPTPRNSDLRKSITLFELYSPYSYSRLLKNEKANDHDDLIRHNLSKTYLQMSLHVRKDFSARHPHFQCAIPFAHVYASRVQTLRK